MDPASTAKTSGIDMPSIIDRRVDELIKMFMGHDVLGKSAYDYISDPLRAIGLQRDSDKRFSDIHYGVVVLSVPYCNWYKVQVGDGIGTIPCTALTQSSNMPVGVRQTNLYPSYSEVYLHLPPGRKEGIILGSVPGRNFSGEHISPDWVSQDGNSGIKRAGCYKIAMESLVEGGGITDRSANRPLDSTTLDWGQLSSTGIGIHIDDFQAFLRVNEMCGLFLNYFDSFTRLAGINMDIVSSVHEVVSRNDEGEMQLFEGHALYPWEALGLFNEGGELITEQDNYSLQTKESRAKFDLPESQENVQPFYRERRYSGYLGQGRRQQIVIPGKSDDTYAYTDDENPDVGAVDEASLVDGTYILRASKRVVLQKTSAIPVPKRIKLAEDQSTDPSSDTDEATHDNPSNYAFSGKVKESGASPHKVGDIARTEVGSRALLQQNASLQDMIAHTVWKADMPFHYHEQDFTSPDVSDLVSKGLNTQEKVNLAAGAGTNISQFPGAKSVDVDHRYGAVEYFNRTATFALTEDGGFVLECGYGSQIIATGGNIRISCPGNLELMPAREVRLVGSDIIAKAHDSVDISAANKDFRVKAENNVQIMAGNSGKGGILLESKAEEPTQEYKDKIGEDVISSGIVMRAANSDIIGYSSSMYFRTGSENDAILGSGDIVFDASLGESDVVTYASNLRTFLTNSVEHNLGTFGEEPDVEVVVNFTRQDCRFGASGYFDGSLAVSKQLQAGGSCVIGGTYVAGQEQLAIPASPGTGLAIATAITTRSEELQTIGSSGYVTYLEEQYYADEKIGNDEFISVLGFSFRDDEAHVQYNATSFEFLELRWQQMARLGEASGGIPWVEPVVKYQGSDLLPWPGNTHWTTPTFLRLERLKLYSSGAGQPQDKGPVYEAPQYSKLIPAPLKGNYTFIN